MIHNLMWIVTGLSIIGVILNIYKRKECFIIWIITNVLWCLYDFHIEAHAQSGLFLIYLILAIAGLIKWNCKK